MKTEFLFSTVLTFTYVHISSNEITVAGGRDRPIPLIRRTDAGKSDSEDLSARSISRILMHWGPFF